MSLFEAQIVRAGRTATVPFAWQAFDSGVYDIQDLDASGQLRSYKLAARATAIGLSGCLLIKVRRSWTERQLLGRTGLTVLVFAVLSLIMGLWLSSRVMSPSPSWRDAQGTAHGTPARRWRPDSPMTKSASCTGAG
ncbi:hypothetical protein [Dokdonella sp.]|uniref:hypothetical protein n=1 Tax=Dokdonella sp. TaxID=2291710 RepID=UPI003527BEC7